MNTPYPTLLCFHGKEHPLSNWHPAYFTVHGITFPHVEAMMMYCKAKLFGDEIKACDILNTTNPKRIKQLGREVSPYNDLVWSAKRERYVFLACYHKFNQNPELRAYLLNTQDAYLVEASPYDQIWGVGLHANDPRILDPKQWLGTNLLGNILMQARDELAKA